MARESTVVGEIVYKVKIDTNDFKAELKKVDKTIDSSLTKSGEKAGADSGKATGVKFTDVLKSSLAGSAVTMAFSKVAGMITGSFDKAISRIDTLNNFPKVMQTIGFSADESSAAIKTLSEGIDGLPTSLDDIVGQTQILTATMGNLNRGMVNATSVSLAFNNMMLAGGQGTQAASNAFMQYNQMLAAGKVDQQAWNSLVSAAPGQMNQLAKSLLGAEAGQKDLYEALKEGTLSFDQMNEAMVRLNTEGGEGFESFERQAREGTGGIGTAIENVQNRIAKAVGQIIDTIGSENIANAINAISSSFSKVAEVVGGVINFIKENEWVQNLLLGFLTALAIVITANVIPAFVAWGVAMLANPITWIIAGITLLVAGIIALVTHIQEVGQWFSDVFGAIGNWFSNVGETIGNFFANVGEQINNFITPIIEWIQNAGQWFYDTLIAPIVNFIQNAFIVVVAIFANIGQGFYNNVVAPIVNFMSMIWENITSTVTNIWNKIVEVVTPIGEWIYNNIIMPISNFFSQLGQGISNAFNSVRDNIVNAFNTVVQWIQSNVIAPIQGFFEQLWNGISQGLSAAGTGIQNTFNSIVGFIKAPINGVIRGINWVIEKINSITVPDWVPGIGGAHANFGYIPELASGGIIPATIGGQLIVAGEGGEDEWVVPESKMASLIEQLGDGAATQAPVFNITFNGVVGTKSELRKCAIEFHDAYEEVMKARMTR